MASQQAPVRPFFFLEKRKKCRLPKKEKLLGHPKEKKNFFGPSKKEKIFFCG